MLNRPLLLFALVSAPIVTLVSLHCVDLKRNPNTPATTPLRKLVYEDIPARVDESERIGDGHFTVQGARIFTPPRLQNPNPINRVRRTIGLDGRVIYPEDGIGVVGKISLEDFRAVLAAVENDEAMDAAPRVIDTVTNVTGVTCTLACGSRKLSARNVRTIKVIAPELLQVETFAPRADGLCPHGDNLRFRKTQGKWTFVVTSSWVS